MVFKSSERGPNIWAIWPCFHKLLAGSYMRIEAAGHQPEPPLDARILDSGSIHYATTSILKNYTFKLIQG